jgi:hypothetical protein
MHLESGLADGLYRLSEARHRLSLDGGQNGVRMEPPTPPRRFYVGKKPAYKKRS